MGTQVDGSGHYVCLPNSDQVLGVDRLHRGVDRGPNAIGGRRSRVLDDVLRWIADEEGHRRGAGLRITPQGMHKVHGLSPFPLIQQCG